jgi:hypothetical protein
LGRGRGVGLVEAAGAGLLGGAQALVADVGPGVGAVERAGRQVLEVGLQAHQALPV